MADAKCCGTCRHFKPDLSWPETAKGPCLRFPPTPVFDQRAGELKTVFPMLYPVGGCGEHAPVQPVED